jgi:cell division protein FtsB
MIPKHLNLSAKTIGKWIAAVIILLLAGFLFLGKNSIINLRSSHTATIKQERELKELHAEIDSLAREAKKLERDTAHIEKIAREKLGMAGKKEKVFKFIEGK